MTPPRSVRGWRDGCKEAPRAGAWGRKRGLQDHGDGQRTGADAGCGEHKKPRDLSGAGVCVGLGVWRAGSARTSAGDAVVIARFSYDPAGFGAAGFPLRAG